SLAIHRFIIATPTAELSTLSLHDALPIWRVRAARARTPRAGRARRGSARPVRCGRPWQRTPRPPRAFGSPAARAVPGPPPQAPRSEEHTSELQSLRHLVCRLLLEKKKN